MNKRISLILIFGILFFCGLFIFQYLKKEKIDNEKIKYVIKKTEPIKLPNSENYIIAEFKKEIDRVFGISIEDEVLLPYSIPRTSINVIFYDKNHNIIRSLLSKNSSITSMGVSNYNLDKLNNKESKLSFFIAEKDSNSDGEINNRDEHFAYVSNLNGENLIQITDRKVKRYQWINNNEELLLTFDNENKEEPLEYGIYNLKTHKITKRKTI